MFTVHRQHRCCDCDEEAIAERCPGCHSPTIDEEVDETAHTVVDLDTQAERRAA